MESYEEEDQWLIDKLRNDLGPDHYALKAAMFYLGFSNLDVSNTEIMRMIAIVVPLINKYLSDLEEGISYEIAYGDLIDNIRSNHNKSEGD